MTEAASRKTIPPAILIGALGCLLASPAAHAQQSRYSSDWRQAASPAQTQATPGRSAELDSLLDELEKLTGDAERGRAADPRFLDDLKNLIRRYSWPWHKMVFADDFRDGDYSKNPQWTVTSGSFAVGADGLVTSAAMTSLAPEPKEAAEPQKRGSDDFARELLGGVLRELTRDRNDAPKPAPPAQQASEARIHIEQQVPNRFAVSIELQSRSASQGRLEFGVGQGAGALGYYLVYNAGASPALSLVRKGSRGSAVIEAAAERIALEDGKSHVLVFTRDETGDMTVALDGKTKLRVMDRAFRSPFDRFVVSNTGGDFTIRSVSVYGVP